MAADNPDFGVYVTLDELTALRFKGQGFDFLPRQPVHSVLSGRHSSRMRGRGLNFEEIRGYLPGDDPRTIDWKITARTREPHVRVYTEERDRPALMVVDQRIGMFFGSRLFMKSVVAAQIAALGAWRVISVGDRAGAVVFDDVETVDVRPQRSQATVMQILNVLAKKNRALRADSSVTPNPGMLNQALEGVARAAKHDYLVTVITDFDGMDTDTRRLMTHLAQRNDVIAIPVFDPLSSEIPANARLLVSDGELQVELDTGRGTTRQKMLELADERIQEILSWRNQLGIPVAPLTTDRDPVDQIRELLGRALERGR